MRAASVQARTDRELRGLALLSQERAAVQHVERHADGPVGLGRAQGRRSRRTAYAQLASGRAHAHGEHGADPRQQRVRASPTHLHVFLRRVLSGEFQVVNRHLLNDLDDAGLWNEGLKHELIAANGSIQAIPEIDDELKKLYRTVWELSQKDLINMAAERGAFIDQSQSFNIHMTEVSRAKMSSMHMYGWKRGLKTGMYYLRSQAAADPIKFTVDRESLRTEADQKLPESARLPPGSLFLSDQNKQKRQ